MITVKAVIFVFRYNATFYDGVFYPYCIKSANVVYYNKQKNQRSISEDVYNNDLYL